MITYHEACADPNLFGPWFEGESWATWRVLDKAIFGQPLDTIELEIFRELTGREEAPSEPADETWLIVGRRGAKTLKAASKGAYIATIGAEVFGYRKRLARGERGVVQILAVDRAQARVCLGYLKAFFEQPMLARMVQREIQDGLELNNSLAIEVTTNDRRRVRGRTVVCAIFDEVAHWKSDVSDSPDEEVYRAVRPAMATMQPGAMLIGISSPHGRRGLLWRKYSESYGKAGPILVVKAPTARMNPTIDSKIIDDAYAADPIAAAAEYGAEFRSDVDAFVTREAVMACVEVGCFERPPSRQLHFVAFTDPAGGSGTDSMTLAIAHREGVREQSTVILDAVREAKPPFSPEAVVSEFCELLHKYRVTKVRGDRYAGEWPREQFRKHGIHYEVADKPKSEIYGDLLPLINSRGVAFLDHDRMVSQFVGLERQVRSGSRDKIDHAPRRGNDDVCNAVAGALLEAQTASTRARGERAAVVIVEGVGGYNAHRF